jgi:putative hydrolase of the HAD superfamily
VSSHSADFDTRRAAFAEVDTWVFDLDNTLYPPHADLWPKIDERITSYIAKKLNLGSIEARELQKAYYQKYGTSLRGLMDLHNVEAQEFLDYVHDIDRSSLEPNPVLSAAIAALPGRKLIFTNGPRDHAQHTAEQLGIHQHFDDIFDILAADLIPKPNAETYALFFKKHDVNPKKAAMFEDLAKNLVVPHLHGMVTTLVIPKADLIDHRDEADRTVGSLDDLTSAFIHFVTNDLQDFLTAFGRI